MKIKELHPLFLESSGVSTDTRKIKPNSIFFALKGENFNANEFAEEALTKGANYAIIDEKPAKENKKLILVENVLSTLQQLAAFHRHFLGLPVIALTGSNGKTTTKELINACLSRKYKTLATTGNLNNHIGVPLTLLSLTEETDIGIVEMGANHPGEIAFLAHLVQPDFGYITNFGKAHLEGFKTLDGVIAAKSELYDHLKDNDKTLFLNFDDPVQKMQSRYSKVFGFGNEGADVKIEFPKGETKSVIKVEGLEIGSQLIGTYNARNMAAAYAIGKFFNVPTDDLKTALEAYIPQNNRSQLIEKGKAKIIMDAYNANPTSMAAAVENFDQTTGALRVAVLGDMFELGDHSAIEHQQLADMLEESSIETVILIGVNFYKTNGGQRIKRYRTLEEFKNEYSPGIFNDALVLIKGSRGMALERLLDLI